MNILSHSPFLKALGWTLLNSLWQFGAIWLLFIIIIQIRKNLSPAVKHGFAMVLMSVGFVWFAAGLSIRYFSYSDFVDQGVSQYNIYYNTPLSFIYKGVQSFLENNLSYISIFYLLVVAGFFIRFFRFFFFAHTIQTRGVSKMRAELRLYVQQLVQHLDIRRKVQVWVSEYIDTPMVMGFLKPTILIPIACINQLSVKQLEAILLHELAHIKRNDYLVNLYVATAEILFFFNPFARLLIKSIKLEREKSCDDWVLQFRFEPYQYASALLALEQNRSGSYSLAIAASGNNKNLLLHRIQRIMGVKKNSPAPDFKLFAYLFAIGLFSFIALVNPGEIVVKNLDTLSTAGNWNPYYAETFNHVIANKTAPPVASNQEKTKEIKKKKVKVALDAPVEKITDEEESLAIPVLMDIKDPDETPAIALLQSSINEKKRDFSIKEKEPTAPPEAATTNEFPFVPNSSFSFYSMEDSTHTRNSRVHSERNHDLVVRQSQVQAQKAFEKVDWNRIARDEKISKPTLLKLRKQIQESLQQMNWQELYKEALDSVNKETTGSMKASLKIDYEIMNHYKVLQQQYESVKIQLQQQQEKYKKGVNIELKDIQKLIQKKKVIVYI